MILALKASRSPGLRDVMTPWSTTTSESSHCAPAFATSVLMDLKDVILRPFAIPVSIRSQGAWQTAATTFLASKMSLMNLSALGSTRQVRVDLAARQHDRVVVAGRDL